ncbi:hypothetical protein KDX20_31870 [Burkholderia cenocepacia]|uniref:hypothetical protein n=1 Tax=Burkholderia cenocepacia TaxID=95486 RepID=UPI00158A0EC4|nr:hypothetical protein [Burkholderia cenocepacia]MBR8159020.1 hypothetical protein [Burkholderia cenocepacia]
MADTITIVHREFHGDKVVEAKFDSDIVYPTEEDALEQGASLPETWLHVMACASAALHRCGVAYYDAKTRCGRMTGKSG